MPCPYPFNVPGDPPTVNLFSFFISSREARAGISCHAQVVEAKRVFLLSWRIFWATLCTPLDLITLMAKRRKRVSLGP